MSSAINKPDDYTGTDEQFRADEYVRAFHEKFRYLPPGVPSDKVLAPLFAIGVNPVDMIDSSLMPPADNNVRDTAVKNVLKRHEEEKS